MHYSTAFHCGKKVKKLNKQLFPFQELEEQLAEQKKLLQSVASRGEEILIQQASPTVTRYFSCLSFSSYEWND